MNRIQNSINSTKAHIKKSLADGKITQSKLGALSKSLDMELLEYVRFQEIKSLAVADGTISLEEGMAIYAAMGETLDTFNGQPAHVKVTLTKFFAELLEKKLKTA